MESRLVQICISAATKLFGKTVFEQYADSQRTVVPIMDSSGKETSRLVVERWPWKRSYIDHKDGTYIDLDYTRTRGE